MRVIEKRVDNLGHQLRVLNVSHTSKTLNGSLLSVDVIRTTMQIDEHAKGPEKPHHRPDNLDYKSNANILKSEPAVKGRIFI